jgi:hypothetical protein
MTKQMLQRPCWGGCKPLQALRLGPAYPYTTNTASLTRIQVLKVVLVEAGNGPLVANPDIDGLRQGAWHSSAHWKNAGLAQQRALKCWIGTAACIKMLDWHIRAQKLPDWHIRAHWNAALDITALRRHQAS